MSSRTDLLKWDEDHDEPYLLIPRFPELRLTPWRESDTNDAVRLFNEPTVAKYSFRRPYPFLPEHLSWMRENVFSSASQTISILLRPLLAPPAHPSHPLPTPTSSTVPFFPLVIIRHTATGKMLGDFQLCQPVPPSSTPEEQAALFGGKAPQTLPAKDQKWELVYNLFPEWQGQGIGGAVLDVVIESWVKWVGIGYLVAGAETANVGSAGLVKSRGFVKTKTWMEAWPEDKGGGERETNRWELNLENHKSRPRDV